jgi:hypothetical protein
MGEAFRPPQSIIGLLPSVFSHIFKKLFSLTGNIREINISINSSYKILLKRILMVPSKVTPFPTESIDRYYKNREKKYRKNSKKRARFNSMIGMNYFHLVG